MGATFSRVKNWTTEVLSNTDLNAEIDNILNNLGPSGVDDYSGSAATMRLTTDPGESGSESLATSLAGELERLRFAIKEMKGSGVTYWYSSSSTSLTELAAAVGGGLTSNRISSCRTSTTSSQAMFLVPHGTNRTVTLKGATTSFTYVIAGTQYNITTDVTSGTLTAAPSSNNECLVNDTNMNDQEWTKQAGEFDTVITVDGMGSEISSLVGKIAGFKTGTEYFLAKVNSTTELTKAQRGFFFDSSDAAFNRVTLANNDTISLMKLTWIFANTTGAVAVSYNNPRVGADEPTSPAVGDYWFDTANNIWKTYDSSSFVASNSLLVGITLQNTSATVAARSFDQFKSVSDLNTITLEKISNTEVRSKRTDSSINVFGTNLKLISDFARWDIATDLAAGLTESPSTTYYLYLTENGESKIDSKAPHDRSDDRRGLYHPHETWRAIGEVYNTSSTHFSTPIAYSDYDARDAYSIVPSVASSACIVSAVNLYGDPITPTLPVKVELRSDATTALRDFDYIRFPLNLTIASGSTLGQLSNSSNYFYSYFVNTGLTSRPIDLAVSSSIYDNKAIASVTALTGNDDSGSFIYSNAAYTSSVVLVSRHQNNQTTAGIWTVAPTETIHWPFFPTGTLDYTSSTVQNKVFPNASEYGDLTTISLTPGVWELRGLMETNNTAAASSQIIYLAIGEAAGNDAAGAVQAENASRTHLANGTSGLFYHISIPYWRTTVTAAKSFYLKFRCDTSNSNLVASNANLSAKRVR